MEIVTTLCAALIFIIFLITIRSLNHHRSSTTNLLPPGPKPYPIIGNIFDIRKHYHRSLHRLSETYGLMMTLRLGSKLFVVVSSPEMIKQIINNHERAASTPYVPVVSTVHERNKYSMFYQSTSSIEWRKLRKIWRENMFSTRCLDASQDLRQEMVTRLCDYVSKCSDQGRVIDVGEVIFVTMLNNVSVSLFSSALVDYKSGDAHGFRESIEGSVNAVSSINIAEVFPILKPFDPQSIKKRAELDFGKLLSIVEGFINRRLEERRVGIEGTKKKKKKKNDMLEVLLDVMETSDGEFTCRSIKHLLLDLIVGSADTTSRPVEWIMTELLRNPDVMSKVQDEVRTVVGTGEEDQVVRESDMSKLPYFKAVVKETLRQHPPAAFFTRVLDREIKINGYVIPNHSQLLFNIFAMGRDPNIWPDPDKFDPERFMGASNHINFKGRDFEFLPFGSGRRICPGMPFADRMMHKMVATLVRKFDWKLEPGMNPEDVDISEKPMVMLRKNVPLMAIPVKPPCMKK